MDLAWQAVLPIRSGAGKTRLSTDFTELFARDTLATALRAQSVCKVIVVGRDFADLDVITVDDPGIGLNAAIAAGLAHLSGPAVVILGDLPTLTAKDLDDVLRQASAVEHGLVIDHNGTGTTMITIKDPPTAALHFGPDSASAFLLAGYQPLDAPLRARLDIDTEDDLMRALELGVGVNTASAVVK